jgi:threonine dehydrogenase-like Zn-dependent dehydrogenase
MSTGFVGAEATDIPIGGTVVVFAQGTVRLMATAGAKLKGAGLIIGVDSLPARIEMRKFYGADLTVDISMEDAGARIPDLTGGVGVDSAIATLGAEVTFQNIIKVTKAEGMISNIGYPGTGDYVGIPRLAWGVGMAEKTKDLSVSRRTVEVDKAVAVAGEQKN